MRPSASQTLRRVRRRVASDKLVISVIGCERKLAAMIRRAARSALQRKGRRAGQLEIAVVDSREMRRQHGRWLGQPTLTDVLTFDLRDEKDGERIDAQVLVCDDMARRRALQMNTDRRRELLLYVVHGCLHLTGYDDRRPGDAARMHRQEDTILRALGYGPVYSIANRSKK